MHFPNSHSSTTARTVCAQPMARCQVSLSMTSPNARMGGRVGGWTDYLTLNVKPTAVGHT